MSLKEKVKNVTSSELFQKICFAKRCTFAELQQTSQLDNMELCMALSELMKTQKISQTRDENGDIVFQVCA